jgi:predicted nucleic acid-binding protein
VRHLRSLDALHIASALSARVDLIVTLDHQMQRACTELGLAVA